MQKKTNIIGDWVFVTFTAQPGQTRQIIVPNDLARGQMDEASIYTDGRFELTNSEGVSVAFRSPGDFSMDRPDIPADTYTMTALEPSRLVCFHPKQRGNLFNSAAVILSKNETFSFPVGHQVIVARGSIGFNNIQKSALSLITVSSQTLIATALEPDTMLVEVWR